MENPLHTYSSVGIYIVTLTVEGSYSYCADVDTATVEVISTVSGNANGPYEGIVGIPVAFEGSASGGVPPYKFYWSFGDNAFSHLQNPDHVYDKPGYYIVSLKVTDDIGGDVIVGTSALIKPATEVVADAHGPYSGYLGDSILFTGSAIGGTGPYSWHWEFGDGSVSNLQNPTYAYGTIDVYTVTLTVTDIYGKTDDDTATVTVTSHAPNKPSKPTGPASGKAGTEYSYSSSTTDPDGDQVFYKFDWDDGTDSGWLGPFSSGATCEAKHIWNEEDSYSIKVKAKDVHGMESVWSDPLPITMPRNKLVIHRLIELLEERFPILYQILQRFLQI